MLHPSLYSWLRSKPCHSIVEFPLFAPLTILTHVLFDVTHRVIVALIIVITQGTKVWFVNTGDNTLYTITSSCLMVWSHHRKAFTCYFRTSQQWFDSPYIKIEMKKNIAKGTTDLRDEFSLRKFKHKSWSNFIFRISTKPQLQNLNQTWASWLNLKFKILTKT